MAENTEEEQERDRVLVQIDTTYKAFKERFEDEDGLEGHRYKDGNRQILVVDDGDREYTISTTFLPRDKYDIDESSEAHPEKGEPMLYERPETEQEKYILVEVNESYDERGARNVDPVMRRTVRPEDLETTLDDAFTAVNERTYRKDTE